MASFSNVSVSARLVGRMCGDPTLGWTEWGGADCSASDDKPRLPSH